MIIFLDFDDVLFNTKKFKNEYFNLFKKRKITRKIFKKFYYDPLDNRKIKNYSPIGHIERICKEINLDFIKSFKKDVRFFTDDTSGYVFDDVVPFLEKFSKKQLVLVSFSKTNFQKAKIFNSGIVKYFDQIKIVNELKGDIINKIIKNKKSKENYFIDDRVEHIQDAKMKNKNLNTIFFLRKESRYRDRRNKYCDYSVKNIEEILTIINSNKKNVKTKK